MLKGFKDFLMRGNVLDMAVAVVMGTAFTAVVSSVTTGVVEPLLAVLGGNSQLGLGIQLIRGKQATFVGIGPIVSAALDFVMVAAVLYFALILPMNTLKKRFSRPVEKKATQEELLAEIRDLLLAQAVRDAERDEQDRDAEPAPPTATAPRRGRARRTDPARAASQGGVYRSVASARPGCSGPCGMS